MHKYHWVLLTVHWQVIHFYVECFVAMGTEEGGNTLQKLPSNTHRPLAIVSVFSKLRRPMCHVTQQHQRVGHLFSSSSLLPWHTISAGRLSRHLAPRWWDLVTVWSLWSQDHTLWWYYQWPPPTPYPERQLRRTSTRCRPDTKEQGTAVGQRGRPTWGLIKCSQ